MIAVSLYEEIYAAMEEAFVRRAGYAPDEASDLGIRMGALAAQLEEQAQKIEELSRQAYPETATGLYLDRHAQVRGLARKAGVCAAGSLTFRRDTAAGYDVLIPAGTLCQTTGEAPVRFETTQDTVLPAGEVWVTAPARSVEETPEANAAAGRVTVMITPPQGVTAVSNETPFLGGAAPEDDGALLARVRVSYQAAGNGCNAGYYRQLAMGQPGVASAAVLTGRRGAGSVDVVVFGRGTAPAPEQLEALGDRVAREREIGVDALVRAAEATPVSLTLEVAPMEGWDFAAVSRECAQSITELARDLAVGQPLYLARVTARALEADGVLNCRVAAPAEDPRPLEDRVLLLEALTVRQMEVV